MPSYRNRVLGLQLYKFRCDGFLQWGYNFYFERHSLAPVDPFLINDANYFVPAGDAFSVYPAPDGSPWESIRLLVFYDGIQDMRAYSLCEQLYGKDYVMGIIEEEIEPITFKSYPLNGEYLLKVRERINRAIAEHKKH